MTPTLLRASLRWSIRHRWQSGLALLGIALGVAVVVAVDLANTSARRAFELSSDAVFGRATHQVLGGPSGLPDRVYARLRLDGVVRDAAPVVEGHVSLPADPGRSFLLLGVDPFAEAPFRSWIGGSGGAAPRAGSGAGLARLMTQPATVLLSAPAARRLRLAPGDGFELRAAGRTTRVTLAGVVKPRDEVARTALADVIIADISTAQELLQMDGRLSRIDLIVPAGGTGRETLAAVRARLPPGASIVTTGSRSRAAVQMTEAFNLNLFMLSLLALVVGVFLIYNTMTFSVVQRRALIGSLRALGVTRRQVLALVMGEACVIGGAGTLLGLGLGALLARVLLRLVARTINDLYFSVHVSQVVMNVPVLWKGVALGTVAVLVAAAVPALEATRVPPRAALARSDVESRMRRMMPRAALAGVIVLVLSGVLVVLPGGLASGFGALFGVIAGCTLIAPAAVYVLVALLQRAVGTLAGGLGAMAVRGVAAGLSRTAVAVAALMVALATTVGVGVMVDSFRASVAQWLHTTLRADIYVSMPGPGARPTLDPALVRRVGRVAGVAHLSMGRTVTVQSPRGPVELIALRMAPESYRGFRFVAGRPDRAWPAFDNRQGVLVSEPFAWHHRLHPGDTVTLHTDRGPHAFRVAGVFRDYGSDRGVVLMSRDTFNAYWNDRRYNSIGVYAAPGTDLDALMDRLRGAAGPGEALLIRSNRAIRATSLEVFDRTFTITIVLRILATVVAFVGILSALMALQLERAREIAVLRACGLTRGQVWGMVSAQTGVMGFMAGILSVPVGLGLALILIDVINRRSFGWTLDLRVDPLILLEAVLLACAAALLAGLYPAWRMSRTPPALAMREE